MRTDYLNEKVEETTEDEHFLSFIPYGYRMRNTSVYTWLEKLSECQLNIIENK